VDGCLWMYEGMEVRGVGGGAAENYINSRLACMARRVTACCT